MQFDGWYAPNCKAMHLCVAVTFLDVGFEQAKLSADDVWSMDLKKDDAQEKLAVFDSLERAKLYMEEAALSFEAFPKTRHLANDIAAHLRLVLVRYDLKVNDVRLATHDGGSNMLAAVKLLMLPCRYCYPHKLQRAILQGIGDKNVELAELEKKIDTVSHKTNTSYAARQVRQRRRFEARCSIYVALSAFDFALSGFGGRAEEPRCREAALDGHVGEDAVVRTAEEDSPNELSHEVPPRFL